jgi:hypothetical protein
MPPAGKSVLTGKVTPPRLDSEVKLIYEGKERAAAHTDSEGRYEFKELPDGTYEVRATAPGHAEDVAKVVIPENQNVEQTAVLLPIVSIDGVDWAAGKIRATGTGLPPPNTANDSVRRAGGARVFQMHREICQYHRRADQDRRRPEHEERHAQQTSPRDRGLCGATPWSANVN